MEINHVNLIRAGFKNTHNGTLWIYHKGVVQVSIFRESGIEGEFIIHLSGKRRNFQYDWINCSLLINI